VIKKNKKIVILALDGLDFKLTKKYLKAGLLPNFKKLAKNGFFSSLKTTTPPQSPVAWASFITGARPAEHGVFDFIVRNPKNYLLSPVFSPGSRRSILKKPPFWKKLGNQGIGSEILFLPVTYPPQKLHGNLISGMGIPDILGTEGTFTLFTTDKKLLKGRRGRRIKLQGKKDCFKGAILGPKYQTFKDITFSKLPLEVFPKKGSAVIKIQKQTVDLKPKQFSRFIKLKFKLGAWRKIHGFGKFFLASLKPLILYLSPINIDPEKPVFDISYPKNFAQKLASHYGLFISLGLPHDTWALNEGIFREKDFLFQAEEILAKKEQIILDRLKKSKKEVFIGYFGTCDQVQHMFFKHLDSKSKYKNVIPYFYQKMDKVVDRVLNKIDKKTLLVVLSDHGFASFDWEVNLNTWLKKESFLTLKSGKQSAELYENVDWAKTHAFAAGFNTLYINRKGREAEGIVTKNQANKLIKNLKAKLEAFKHPKTKKTIVKRAYSRKDLGLRGNQEGPDLIVGYYKGFRASWETAVGAVPKKVVCRREQKWSGDHLFDASEIPGVIFANQKLNLKNPFIGDVAKQVLPIA